MSEVAPSPVTSASVVNKPQRGPSPDRLKGVLMSNRPVSVSENQNRVAGDNVPVTYPRPFMPSGTVVNESHIGFPPAKERAESNFIAKMELAGRQRLEKEDGNVHVKHKRWLKEFTNTIQNDKLAEMETTLEKESKRQKFMETQAQLRKALMSTLDVKQEEVEELLKTQNTMKVASTLKEAVQESSKPPKKKPTKEKPKWAMSEKESDANEAKEVDDLLDFAKNLDFDEFISDVEVKEAINVIQTRVKELQSEASKEEKEEEMQIKQEEREQAIIDRLNRNAERMQNEDEDEARRRVLSFGGVYHETEWNSSVKVDDDEKEKLNAMKLAENIIKNDSNIGKVHSKSSLATVLDSARSATSSPSSSVSAHENRQIEKMLKELNSLEANKSHSVPVVTHDSSHQKEASTVVFGGNNPTVETNTVKRILLKMKKDGDYVQNLPYLYRCPSI